MPAYTDLTTSLQSLVSATAGTKIKMDFVLDPENRNIVFSDQYGPIKITGIKNEINLDVNYERRPVLGKIRVELLDPEGTLNPNNENSYFSNAWSVLYKNAETGDTSIQVYDYDTANFTLNSWITIKGKEHSYPFAFNELLVKITSITDNGSYLTLGINETIDYLHEFKIGSMVFVNSFKEECLVRMWLGDDTTPITLFRGRMTKEPAAGKDSIIVDLSETKKEALDSLLVGADTDNTNKLMFFNSSGTLTDSTQITSASGTFDRTKAYPLDECRIGKWIATFTSANEFTLDGPGTEGLSCNINYGLRSATTVSNYQYQMVVDGNYLYYIDGDNGYLRIYNISDPESISLTGSVALSGTVAGNITGISKSGNYIFVNYYTIFQSKAWIESIDVSTPSSPSISDTITTDSELPSGMTDGKSAISGNYLYITDLNDSIHVIDISTPAAMVYDNSYGGAGSPNYTDYIGHIEISGNYLYTISLVDKYLTVWDISTPTSLSLAGTLDLSSYGTIDLFFYLSGNYIYFCSNTDNESTLRVIDITTPTSPSIVSNATFSGREAPYYIYDLKAAYRSGNYLYCLFREAIVLINATTLTSMSLVESIPTNSLLGFSSNSYGWAVSGSDFFISSDDKLITYSLDPTYINKQGSNYFNIGTQAWGGTYAAGDTVEFYTGITFNDKNPIQAVYDIINNYTNIPLKLLAASAYFGTKQIGTLYRELENGDTSILVKVNTPELIKTGETLTIDSTDFSITSGNSDTTKYPPYITLTISAHSGSTIEEGTAVYWKTGGSADTDFNFEEQHEYANIQNIKLTLHTEMTVLEALEAVMRHVDGFLFPDNWGKENIYLFKENNDTPIEITGTTNLIMPDPTIENLPMRNDFVYKYGFDFYNDQYYYSKTYQGHDGVNRGYWRTLQKTKAEIYLPGFYEESKIDAVSSVKIRLWQFGVQVIEFNTSLEGIVLKIGDKINITSTNPSLTSESFIIIGREFRYYKKFEMTFWAYNYNKVWAEG